MKKKINLTFFIFFPLWIFSQKNSIELNLTKTGRWHFLESSIKHEFKNNLELKIGGAYNLTSFFNEDYYDETIFIRPDSQKFKESFALQYGIKKYFIIKENQTRFFLSYNHSISKTSFIYKTVFSVNNELYYVIQNTPFGTFFNQNLNLGLQTKLTEKVDFNVGLGINHLLFTYLSDIFKMRFEIGFVYSIKRNSEKKNN